MLTVSLCCRRPRATLTLLLATDAVAVACFFTIRRPAVRWLGDNAITAIPTGLFDFTTALTDLYGRLRITLAVDAHPARAQRSPVILGYRIAGPFVCFDQLSPTFCRDINRIRVLPQIPCKTYPHRGRNAVGVAWFDIRRSALGTWGTTLSRRYRRACWISQPRSTNCTCPRITMAVDVHPTRAQRSPATSAIASPGPSRALIDCCPLFAVM